MQKVNFLELHEFLASQKESYKLHRVSHGMIWVDRTGEMLAKSEPSEEPFEFDYFINA